MKTIFRFGFTFCFFLITFHILNAQNIKRGFALSQEIDRINKENEELSAWLLKLTENYDEIVVNSDEGIKSLYIAIQLNMPKTVKRLIDDGVEINNSLQERYSPLMMAIYYGNAEIVEMLIEGGADLNKKSSQNSPPLHALVYNHRDYWKEIRKSDTQRLLDNYKKKLGVNNWNEEKEKKFLAYKNAANFKLEMLIAKTLDFEKIYNEDTSVKDTTLLNKLYESYCDFLDASFKMGPNAEVVNVTIPDLKNWTGAIMADYNYEQIVKDVLNTGYNIDETNEYGKTAFYESASNNNIDKAKLLLKYGADINYTIIKEGYTKGSTILDDFDITYETMSFLIDAGANKLGKDRTFVSMVDNYMFDKLNLLIEKGIVDVVEIDKKQSLISEVVDNPKALEMVLKHGASLENNPNVLFSVTPTVYNYNKLIELGADVFRKNEKGETVLWLIVNNLTNYKNEFAEIFIHSGAGEYELFKSIDEGNTVSLKRILQAGFDVNKSTDSGETIYYKAILTIKGKSLSKDKKKEMISLLKNAKKENK